MTLVKQNTHRNTPKPTDDSSLASTCHLSASDCAQTRRIIQHRAVLILFSLILQTIISSQMVSTERYSNKPCEKKIKPCKEFQPVLTSFFHWSSHISVSWLQPRTTNKHTAATLNLHNESDITDN